MNEIEIFIERKKEEKENEIKFYEIEKNFLSSFYQKIEEYIPIQEKVLNHLFEELELDKHIDDWYNTYLEKDFKDLYEKVAKLGGKVNFDNISYIDSEFTGKELNYVDWLKEYKEYLKIRIEDCDKEIKEIRQRIEKLKEEF